MNSLCFLFVIAFSISIAGCTRSENAPHPSASQNSVSFSTPPFSTKEPDRYQATRTITITQRDADGTVNETRTTNVSIARDGLQRREEYEAGTLGTVVYLDTIAGHFVMVPQKKVYANTSESAEPAASAQLPEEPEILSPDYLLNESSTFARYERSGAESIGGRTATKYRVIIDSLGKSETFIWVDETLGMPIASQSISTEGDVSRRVSMELRDLRTEVDSKLFMLPADYRQITAAQIRTMIRSAMGDTVSKPTRQ